MACVTRLEKFTSMASVPRAYSNQSRVSPFPHLQKKAACAQESSNITLPSVSQDTRKPIFSYFIWEFWYRILAHWRQTHFFQLREHEDERHRVSLRLIWQLHQGSRIFPRRVHQLCSQTDSLHGHKMDARHHRNREISREQRLNLLVSPFEELKKPFQGASSSSPFILSLRP